jgi:hypothetical protein
VAKKKQDSVKEPKTTVEVAKDRYERAKAFYDNQRILAVEDIRFAMADSDNNWQWPAEIYRNRANVDKRPCLTVNITAQHCNQVLNNIRQNRPSAKVSPADDNADIETAKILGGMLRTIQRNSSADIAHDLAAEFALYGGEGYWRIVTEYEDYNSFDQCIRIKAIDNPMLVYIDPDAKERDRSDAKWAFVFEDISKDQAREEHPDIDPASWAEDSRRGWVRENTIRRAEYFWCEYKDDTLLLLEDASSVLKSELPEGYTVVMDSEAADSAGSVMAGDQIVMRVVYKRETKRKQWKWAKLLGGEDKPVDERDWPGQYLPIITVVGKELNVNGEIVRKGMVRDLKDPARMVNYSFSAAVETLALQNKVPYMASAEAIEGFEDIWAAANLENRAYLPFNAFDDNGAPIPMPQRQAPVQMATAQVQMLGLATEQMRAASGQQNANFGIKSEASSGIGIQRLKQQGEIATFHFPDNLAIGLKYEAKVILDLIPKVYESRRIVRILGLDGKEEAAMLDPQMAQAYAENQQAVESSIDKIFNPGYGKYDVAIDTGPSYSTQRQEAADFIGGAVQRDPSIMQVAGDLVWKVQDFPMAEEFSERFKKLPSIAQLLQDDKKQQEIPPQVQQQIQQLDQAIQGLTNELEQKDEQLRNVALKAQKEESKSLSLQLELEKRQAIDEIRSAMPEQEEPQDEAEELLKIQLEEEAKLREKALDIAGQIVLKSMEPQAEMPMEQPDQTAEIMARLVQTQEALLQTIAQPRQAQIAIIKNPDGSFTGTRVEQ